jgi:hypothetical protein
MGQSVEKGLLGYRGYRGNIGCPLLSSAYQQEVAVQIVAAISQYVTDLNLAGLKLD